MKVKDLTKTYGDKTVLRSLSFEAEDGKLTALRAPSGWGKTTLFRLLSGLEMPDAGEMLLPGRVAYLFQEPRLFPSASALENVACVSARPRKEAAALLSSLGIPEREQKKRPAQLSGGMKQRVALARLLHYCAGTDVSLVLLDEPFQGIDPGRKEEVMRLTFAALAGKTVLMTTHDKGEEGWADRLIVLG